MNREQILLNVDNLTAEQLFDFIRQGIVTLDELQRTGNLDFTKRRAIANILAAFDKQDDDAWERCRYGNESVLSDYISNYPAGRHVANAKERIDELERLRREAAAQKQAILDKIRKNPNSCSPQEIITYINNRTITRDDLINYCNIPAMAIDNLQNIQTPIFNNNQAPIGIPQGFTEVFFWGNPGSGKSCALGAILQMAEQQGFLEMVANGPGYDYANRLKNLFTNVGVANNYLPQQTPPITQYLPFTLTRPGERSSRSVSLIELAGSIFLCFYKINANQQLPTQQHQDTFDLLNTFLNDNNRKIHFFFIDYGDDNSVDENGLRQSDYLTAAAQYLNNHDVFRNTTDAIYVVLTKSDLLTDENGNRNLSYSDRVERAKTYVREKFPAFTNTLRLRCREHSINRGLLMFEPFSLGEVYFQQICNFEGSAASRIVDILMERIPKKRRSIIDYLRG
jgi:hypothetical protein